MSDMMNEDIQEFAMAWRLWQDTDGWNNENWDAVLNAAETLCERAGICSADEPGGGA